MYLCIIVIKLTLLLLHKYNLFQRKKLKLLIHGISSTDNKIGLFMKCHCDSWNHILNIVPSIGT